MTDWQEKSVSARTMHPSAFHHSIKSSTALVKRLSHLHTYQRHSSCINAVDWSLDGSMLVSAGDDCRVKIWSTEHAAVLHSFDSGHTSCVYAAKFMPNNGNEHIITAAADRQIRHINLHKNAIKPYSCHHGRVRALVPIDSNLFVSGSDDGTARHFDTRESVSSQDAADVRKGDIIADQSEERSPLGRAKLGINSVAVDPMRPHLFITGSNDPLVRLYDRRMTGVRSQSNSQSSQWVSCYAPSNLTGVNMAPRTTRERVPFVTGVRFSSGGDQLFASYSGDHIYSFDSMHHARASDRFCKAQDWSRANSASGTRSASRHAMIHQSSSWLGTAVSTEHANLPRSDLPQGASARVAATTQTDQAVSQAIVPGPQPDASQPRDHSDAIAAGGGLTQAAAAAVAHIRRRRAASTSSRAQDWDTVHACPAVHSQSSPPVAQPLLDDATNMRSAARNARQQTDVAAAAGDGVPRSLDHDDLAAGVRQADELQHVQGRSQLPASASLPVADKAQRSQRPPLPSHSIRRSARLHKPANASPSGADKGSAADADAVVQSPHTSSAQGNIAASSPVQRHSCKRKLAEFEGCANECMSADSKPRSLQAQPLAPHLHSQHRHFAMGAPFNSVGTGCAQQPDSENIGRQMQPSCSHNLSAPPHTHTELPSHTRLAQMPASCRGVSIAPPLPLAQNARRPPHVTHSRHQGVQACSPRLIAEQPHRPHQQVEAGSSRQPEQPTASTGTSRPESMLPSVPSQPLSQATNPTALPPSEFLRLRYTTDPPSSADNSREPTPDRALQAGHRADSLQPAPIRHPHQLRSSRLAPPVNAACLARQPAHSSDTAQAIGSAPSTLLESDAEAAAGPQQPEACMDAGPAASGNDEPLFKARGRESVEGSTRDLPRQLSSSTMDRLSDTSPRGSCQRSRLPSSRHSQGKNDAPQAEDEVLSPSMSTVAQFPADVAEHRVGSAQDAHNPGSGEQDAVSGHTAEPRHSAADANWTQPAQISLAGGLQPTSCLRATAVTGRVCDQGTVQTSARQRPLQPIRHDAHDAGAANLQAEPSRLDSLQQQSTVSQTGGTMEPAWGPHSNSPDQLQFADGAHVPFASAETTEAAPLPEVPHESARLVGAANSLVGAVIQRGSDAEADAEVLDASDMYQQSYEGHCNLSQNAELCLMGSRDAFVVSGSDDGWIFIWDQQSGHLVNMLLADDRNVSTVAAHPFMPVLASSGSEPVIKLWSPQAEEPCRLDRALAVVTSNARELAEGDRRSMAGAPPGWLHMLGNAVSAELMAPGDPAPLRANTPVRCVIM